MVVKSQDKAAIRRIRCQATGFFFANISMNQQIDRIGLLRGQIVSSQPDARVLFLAQDIEPAPLIQLTQDPFSAEFIASNPGFGCT